MSRYNRCRECYNMKCVFVTGEREDFDTSECQDFRPMTNADRIRQMTDEELADFIGGIFTIERDPWGDYDPRTVVTQEPRVELRNREDALDWLKEEAKE